MSARETVLWLLACRASMWCLPACWPERACVVRSAAWTPCAVPCAGAPLSTASSRPPSPSPPPSSGAFAFRLIRGTDCRRLELGSGPALPPRILSVCRPPRILSLAVCVQPDSEGLPSSALLRHPGALCSDLGSAAAVESAYATRHCTPSYTDRVLVGEEEELDLVLCWHGSLTCRAQPSCEGPSRGSLNSPPPVVAPPLISCTRVWTCAGACRAWRTSLWRRGAS